MIDQQLKLLTRLAGSDGTIDETELKLIKNLGSIHGLGDEEVNEIINSPQGEIDYQNLTEDERFDYLYNIIQLMKIDGKVTQSEIEFCERVAVRLGYLPGVVADMSAYIYSDPKITTKRSFLNVKRFLLKKRKIMVPHGGS